MTKIVSGLLLIVLTLVVVGGSAFAVFSSSVTASGSASTADTPSLDIGPGHVGPFGDTFALPILDGLSPGEEVDKEFSLRNSSNNPNSEFTLTGKLNTPSGNWTELKDQIELVIYLHGESADSGDAAKSTGWKTLNDWNAADVSLPGSTLNKDDIKDYHMTFRLKSTAGNDVSGKAITNIILTLTGTEN